MDNGFKGRGKNVTGSTSGIHKRGEGVSSGKPAGKDVSYSRRTENTRPSGYSGGYQQNQNGSQTQRSTTRGLGGGKLIVIVLIAVLLFGGGGSFLGALLGSSSSSSGSSGGSEAPVSLPTGSTGEAASPGASSAEDPVSPISLPSPAASRVT